MANKGSVRIIRVNLADNKLEKRALFLKHETLPEPRREFKEWASDYLIGLLVDDMADDVQLLKDEDRAIETEQSDKQLDKFDHIDIEAYLARRKSASALASAEDRSTRASIEDSNEDE